MRQISKCNNEVEEAENKGLGLAVREREYRVWLRVGGRTQQKFGGREEVWDWDRRKQRGEFGAGLISFTQNAML